MAIPLCCSHPVLCVAGSLLALPADATVTPPSGHLVKPAVPRCVAGDGLAPLLATPWSQVSVPQRGHNTHQAKLTMALGPVCSTPGGTACKRQSQTPCRSLKPMTHLVRTRNPSFPPRQVAPTILLGRSIRP